MENNTNAMSAMSAIDAFEAIYERLYWLDESDRSPYKEEAEIVRKALESIETLKAAAKLIASL